MTTPDVTPDVTPHVIDCPRRGHCCPQRQWVGLTDDEINAIPDCEYMDFYKAINAKLKEKNGG
jgi:hypothetical protein